MRHDVRVLPHLADPEAARAWLESLRWPRGPVCPHCRTGQSATRIERGPDSSVRPGLWRCGHCGKQFTVTVNTLFQDSRLPLHLWLRAIERLCLSPEGVTARELHLELAISYKTAWKLLDRIRYVLNRPRPRGRRGGVARPESLHPWKLQGAVARFLKLPPPRKHPDRLERAVSLREQK